MKKIKLFLLAGMLLFPPLIFAQDGGGGSSGGFFIGIKGGGIRSTMRTDYQFKFAEHRFGPVGGISLGYKLTDAFGIQADILYSQEGASYVPPNYLYASTTLYSSSDELYLQKLNSNVALHTVETPLLINFYLGSNNIQPKVFIGASYNYIFYAEAKNKLYIYDWTTDYYAEVSGRTVDNVTSRFQEYYIGGIIGGGISFETFGVESTVEARLKIGAQKVNNIASLRLQGSSPNATEIPETYLMDVSMRTFMITYGINF